MTAYHFAVGGGLTIPDATEAALAKDYGHDQGDALACYIGQELELGMRGTSLYPKVKVSGFDREIVLTLDADQLRELDGVVREDMSTRKELLADSLGDCLENLLPDRPEVRCTKTSRA
jgi:hypothetical protein